MSAPMTLWTLWGKESVLTILLTIAHFQLLAHYLAWNGFSINSCWRNWWINNPCSTFFFFTFFGLGNQVQVEKNGLYHASSGINRFRSQRPPSHPLPDIAGDPWLTSNLCESCHFVWVLLYCIKEWHPRKEGIRISYLHHFWWSTCIGFDT